ncbi:MAG: hypothetical protein KC493_08755 [Bacteriovoracaceae bacterium]|nr:hypothetical protein [Bacteriovoracaceae bacterium]
MKLKICSKYFKYFMIAFLVTNTCFAKASSLDGVVLKNKRIMFYTPHLFNPKFFGFEFGFVTDKKIEAINYPYNTFAKILISEDFYRYDSTLRAGALGLKAGILLPTQPWIPLSLELAVGYAKTSLQEDPWLGEDEERIQSKDLMLAEAGIVFTYRKKVLFRLHHQFNNVNYFVRKTFFSVGSNF